MLWLNVSVCLVNLELYTASDVMKRPVHCLREVEKLDRIVQLLRGTKHGGFPVLSGEGTEPGDTERQGAVKPSVYYN